MYKTDTVISLDLDWLNDKSDPIDSIRDVLQYIPNNTPAIMIVEHHHLIARLSKLIRLHEIQTPFNIINIDEHHDYYIHNSPYDLEGHEINCGNWGYHLPLSWYNRYTWVCNTNYAASDWTGAVGWLEYHNIKYSKRSYHGLAKLRTNIKAIVCCLSPDYIDPDTEEYIEPVIEIICEHFNTLQTISRLDSYNANDIKSWGIRPRMKHKVYV